MALRMWASFTANALRLSSASKSHLSPAFSLSRCFSTASSGPATPESNNLPIGRPSSGSDFINPKGYSASKDIQFIESSVLVRGETPTAAITKANIEQLAQNRGNAMQRYKEKKYQRYDKHIQYESRKARADTRKQVKGRFVKASEAPDG